jgi:hypothetical protein
VFPQETPVSQKTNQKSVPYKMPAPSFFSRPQAQSSSKLVSYRLVGLPNKDKQNPTCAHFHYEMAEPMFHFKWHFCNKQSILSGILPSEPCHCVKGVLFVGRIIL